MVASKGATARSYQRRQAAEARRKHQKFIRSLMVKYDKSQSGNLQPDELKELLKDLNHGEPVTDEEVGTILNSVDHRNGYVNGCIDLDELETALLVWKNYKENAPLIVSTFEKYDTDQSGKLGFEEFKALLKDLNEGHDVDDEEARQVMEKADSGKAKGKDGQIDRTEVVVAIAEWYSSMDKRRASHPLAAEPEAMEPEPKAQVSAVPKSEEETGANTSSCCRIS